MSLALAVREFFALLDYTEESDNGRVFHPVAIGCCRVMMTPKVEEAIAKMKANLAEQAAKYFLDQDDDSHWYLIPEERRAEWEQFLRIPSHDERSWDLPSFAQPCGGGPQHLTFENPRW